MNKKIDTVNLLGHKILIVLYFLIPFIPRLRSIDPIGAQWVYFGIVDILGILFLFSNRKSFRVTSFSKASAFFFSSYFVFFLVGVFSAFYAINVSETIGDAARVGTTLVGAFVLFRLIREMPKSLFSFTVKVGHVSAIIIGFQVLSHLIGKFDEIRNNTLLEGTELLFGNRNVTAAYAAILVPFMLWGAVKHTKRWKIVSLVALFGSLSTVLLIASRSTILSVSVVLVIFFIHAFVAGNGEEKLSRKLTSTILPILGVIALVLLVGTNINRVEKSKSNSLNELVYGTKAREIARSKKKKPKVTRRTKKSVKTGFDSGRLLYFEMAYDDFKNNPIKGVGLGNWNLAQKDKYFAQSEVDRFLYPLRVHNDFLQILAELGLMGTIPYLTMFIVMLFMLIQLARSKPDNKEGWMYVTILLTLVVYGLDALLNFPMERTPMQGAFAIIVALLAGSYDYKYKGVSKEFKVKPLFIAGLGVGMFIAVTATIFSYYKYKAFITDNYVLADMMNKNLLKDKYGQSYKKVKNDMINFFDMTSVGRPSEHVLAMYAMNEGRIDEALNHLDNSIKASPHHYESKMLKAIIYNQKRIDRDSAIYYARQGFENYPAITNNYAILINSYRQLKDTANYFKTIDQRLERFPDDISQWQLKSKRIVSYYKDYDRAIAVIDEGLEKNPGDSTLTRYRDKIKVTDRSDDIRAWYAKAFEYIDQKDYKNAKVEFLKILDVTPINQPTLLNLGIIEIKLKQYEEAVKHLSKCIELKKFKDGAPEYNRGLAYERLGQMEKAKKDYTMSKRKGYGLAQKLPASRLNKIDD